MSEAKAFSSSSQTISDRFKLSKSQYELDFVDIDPSRDTPLFIDPHHIGASEDLWSTNASYLIQSFFQRIITNLRAGEINEALKIFSELGEPNETCLGLSRRTPKGRSVNKSDTKKIFQSIAKSKAVASGLVEDLQDAHIFVPGFGPDKLSDISTDIIRSKLIEYTQQQCLLWGIPLQSGVASGALWNPTLGRWERKFTEMLIVDGKPILLVPKASVSFKSVYTPQKYNQKFVLEFLQNEHVSLQTSLVRRKHTKKGEIIEPPYKKTLIELGHTSSKEVLLAFTQKYPEVFKDFKQQIKQDVKKVKDQDLTAVLLSDIVKYLIVKIKTLPKGEKFATEYQRLVVGILELLFPDQLMYPRLEVNIHDGRKRVDITFTNRASGGFFHVLPTTHQKFCPILFVECKNYTNDIGNPEIDQLTSRFGGNRGIVGVLTCRDLENRKLAIKRCADTYSDGRGVALLFLDQDLIHLLELRREERFQAIDDFMFQRYTEICT